MRYTASERTKIMVRKRGRRIGIISRLKFELGQEIVGWANYKNRVYPLYSDGKGGLYLEENGWTATSPRPLTRTAEGYRLWTKGF
jgi:hypothetical protein